MREKENILFYNIIEENMFKWIFKLHMQLHKSMKIAFYAQIKPLQLTSIYINALARVLQSMAK